MIGQRGRHEIILSVSWSRSCLVDEALHRGSCIAGRNTGVLVIIVPLIWNRGAHHAALVMSGLVASRYGFLIGVGGSAAGHGNRSCRSQTGEILKRRQGSAGVRNRRVVRWWVA